MLLSTCSVTANGKGSWYAITIRRQENENMKRETRKHKAKLVGKHIYCRNTDVVKTLNVPSYMAARSRVKVC